MSTQRNAPCPCGSGQKFKKCCMGKAPPGAKKKMAMTVGAIAIAAGASSGAAYYYTDIKNAFIVGVVGIIIAAGYLILRDPPKSTGRSGADRIDFGK